MENDLPIAFLWGVSEERFWDSCPSELKPYKISYEMKMKQKDEEAWAQGMYFYSAVSAALAKFAGNKRAEYIKSPVSSQKNTITNEENMTDNQKEKYVEQLFTNLMIMQSNFNNSHNKKDIQGG